MMTQKQLTDEAHELRITIRILEDKHRQLSDEAAANAKRRKQLNERLVAIEKLLEET